MKKILLLLAVACFCLPAFAQTLVEGYIVKNSGDTLRGFIRERVDWYQPYIDFSDSQTSASRKIELVDISMFYLSKYNTYYYSRILDIDKKPVADGKLDRAPARLIVRDTIALRLLVKGAINFYDYTDENFKQHFFVQKNDGAIDELAFVRYMASGQRIAEMPYFVEPLKKMLADCDKVSPSNIRYDQKALTKAIQQYNACFATTSNDYQIKKEGSKLRVSPFVGSGTSQMGFKDSTNPFGADPASANWSTTTSLFAGIRLELNSSRDAVRLVPGVDVMFQKTGDSKAVMPSNTRVDNLLMNFTFVNIGLSVKYLVVKKPGFNIYIRAAWDVAAVAQATSSFTRTDFLVHSTTAPKDFAVYKKLGFVYGGGVGVSYRRLWLDLNYSKNMTPVSNYNANGLCTSYYAALGYRITKN